MKVGCCSSRCLALLLLALLEAITLVFPQQQRCEDLTNICSTEGMTNLNVVATGMEMSKPSCSITATMEMGDMTEWYFTTTTTENATRIVIDGSKYEVEGQLSQILIINNVSLSDEGHYFCRLRRNDGQTLTIPQQGPCLRVLAPAMFQTCEGNSNVPQRGCSETETLNATIGESVDFNIVLVHGGESESCNDQFIQMISLFKIDGPSSRTTLTDCPSSACSYNVTLMERLKVSRTPNKFDITVTLKNLTAADSGSYSAVADVRSPPNSMRMCMYKNFTLVLENPSTNTPTTSGDTQSSISPSGRSSLSEDVLIIIIIVIVVLVVLLMVLGVVVAGLLCWTYKNRHKEKKGEKDGEMYETIKDLKKFKREKKKKKSNGVPLTDQEDTYQRRSVVEEEKMNLPEVWNSDGHPV